jgi:gamma-tubulin complex component 3
MMLSRNICGWLKYANDTANEKLIELLFNKYKLRTHLEAIKRYLLLGQGEFIHLLLEVL